MHKALTQMNLQIHHVIDDITGMNGLAIVDAILTGQRGPGELAKLGNGRIKAPEETIRKSLVAIGEKSICSPSGNPASCTAAIRSKFRNGTNRLRS
jgi:hypothetical protein